MYVDGATISPPDAFIGLVESRVQVMSETRRRASWPQGAAAQVVRPDELGADARLLPFVMPTAQEAQALVDRVARQELLEQLPEGGDTGLAGGAP